MRTTAFLTLTGTGSVIREWLAAGSAAGPELLLLCLAIAGLGLQTLYSDRGSSAIRDGISVANPDVDTQPVVPMVTGNA